MDFVVFYRGEKVRGEGVDSALVGVPTSDVVKTGYSHTGWKSDSR